MLFPNSPVPGEDMRRFAQIVPARRKMIDEAPDTPLPVTYAVNELAKALHPGETDAEISDIINETADAKTFVLRPIGARAAFPYFRAGQFITLTAQVGGSRLTRPYSLSSSPAEALAGRCSVTVRRSGVFSNWLYNEAHVGTRLQLGEPSGEFHHDSLRDSHSVVGIAGGCGVTPFLSMAKAIAEGSEDYDLTLLYGARRACDVIGKRTLDALAGPRVRIVYVFSEEAVENAEHGFITAELIQRYAPARSSFFLCGPDAMYSFVGRELHSLGIKDKFVRREQNAVGRRAVAHPRVFFLKVRMRNQAYVISAREEETLLCAMERAGLSAPSRCRSGSCGFCHSRLLSGKYTVPAENESRRLADLKFGFLHPCCTYPDSDMEIDVPIDRPSTEKELK